MRRWPREIAVPTAVTNTLMRTLDDKIALARTCLAFCDRLARRRAASQPPPDCGGRVMSRAPTWAVVPVKALGDAKQRLASVLPLEARRRLMLVMLQDVLATLRRSRRWGRSWSSRPDAQVAEIARGHGVLFLRERAAQGTAPRWPRLGVCKAHGAARAITLPADVPLATAQRDARLLAVACGQRTRPA